MLLLVICILVLQFLACVLECFLSMFYDFLHFVLCFAMCLYFVCMCACFGACMCVCVFMTFMCELSRYCHDVRPSVCPSVWDEGALWSYGAL